MVNWKSTHSQAKIVGTIATVGGAMMMTLVKGPLAFQPFWFKHGGITYDHAVTHNDISLHAAIKASILVTIGCFSWSAFLILQVFLNISPLLMIKLRIICDYNFKNLILFAYYSFNV